MLGKIIKGISGFYYVSVENGDIYECRAKGILRRLGIRPLPGDLVEISVTDGQEMTGNIDSVLERKNTLARPAVVNTDQVMVVMSLKNPRADLYLLDRLLVMLEHEHMDALICFNKTDLSDEEEIQAYSEIYAPSGYPVFFVSAGNGEGVEALKSCLSGKTTAFTGPSGTGKSSLLNALTKNDTVKTGTLSEKLGRGRNTTRHSEIFSLGGDTYVTDTPGFSSLDLPVMDEQYLEDCFPEFAALISSCRFVGCAHISEPDCAVRRAVSEQKIAQSRYEHYRAFYEEIKEQNSY